MSSSEPASDPGYSSVKKYLLFSLSLPERAIRSGTSVVGGAVRESAELLVPQAFQNSQTYSVLVRQMLDFLVEDVGGVERVQSADTPAKVENFVARKAVGNFIELASLATLHISPAVLLAVVSDVAYGSRTYLRELSADLKQKGVIDENSTIDKADDLLAAVAKASSTTAMAFNTPPLSVDGLKQTIDQTKASVGEIDPTQVIPQAEIGRMWGEMRELADREGLTVLDVSGTVALRTLERVGHVGQGALSTVRIAGTLFDRHVIEHYEQALDEIRTRGLYATLSEASTPYIEAVWKNFSSDRQTVTEDLLTGRLIGQAWGAVRKWFGKDQSASTTSESSADSCAVVPKSGFPPTSHE